MNTKAPPNLVQGGTSLAPLAMTAQSYRRDVLRELTWHTRGLTWHTRARHCSDSRKSHRAGGARSAPPAL